jgi:Coenzyme PQQ synthesis protein D (PqqD)
MMFRRADNVVKEVVDDRAFLLDDRGVEMIVLNPVGTVVWDALDEPRDASTIAASLVDRFEDVTLQELERDVQTFLEELREAGLVVAVNER